MKKLLSILLAASIPTAAYASDLSGWAQADYESASLAGMLSHNVAANNLQEDITREEFCELIVNLYSRLTGTTLSEPEVYPFEDSDSAAVAQAYALGIISGRTENTADPFGNVTREELAKLLINTLKAAEINVISVKSESERLLEPFSDADELSVWALTEMASALKYNLISGISEDTLSPKTGATREQAVAIVNRAYLQFAKEKEIFGVPEFTNLADGVTLDGNFTLEWTPSDGAKNYLLIIKDEDFQPVTVLSTKKNTAAIQAADYTAGKKYTAYLGAEYENGETVFGLPTDFGYQSKNYQKTNISTSSGMEIAKAYRVFPNGELFLTKEDAEAHMVDITVDVWSMKEDGTKYAAKKSLTVNEFLADDVKQIFRNIFNDPSQFPIKSVGGYCWRTTAFGSVSQHSYGTCIDINPDENYYCKSDGTAITGSFWKPYENEYSITPYGVVVSAFSEYGWLWGGDWAGKHSVIDYMHFTYLGK